MSNWEKQWGIISMIVGVIGLACTIVFGIVAYFSNGII